MKWQRFQRFPWSSVARRAFRLSLITALACPFAACRRTDPRSDPAPPATAAASSTPSAASVTPSATPLRPTPATAEDPAARVVRAWSDALDRHDLAALERVYGASVVFYGRPRTKSAVLAAKRVAFAKQPTFRQELIGDVALERGDDARVTATFTKRSGTDAAFSVDTATLVLAPSPAGYVVVEEADADSLRRQASSPSACEAKASEVVNALSEVRRATADAMRDADQSDGGARFGGVGPNDDGEGGITFALGVHTDERFETRVVASVSRDGVLTVTISGDDVAVPAAALRAVREACRH